MNSHYIDAVSLWANLQTPPNVDLRIGCLRESPNVNPDFLDRYFSNSGCDSISLHVGTKKSSFCVTFNTQVRLYSTEDLDMPGITFEYYSADESDELDRVLSKISNAVHPQAILHFHLEPVYMDEADASITSLALGPLGSISSMVVVLHTDAFLSNPDSVFALPVLHGDIDMLEVDVRPSTWIGSQQTSVAEAYKRLWSTIHTYLNKRALLGHATSHLKLTGFWSSHFEADELKRQTGFANADREAVDRARTFVARLTDERVF